MLISIKYAIDNVEIALPRDCVINYSYGVSVAGKSDLDHGVCSKMNGSIFKIAKRGS
jgi:hypothetical protein